MPSAKILEEKKALTSALVEKIKKAQSGVLVTYAGITVEQDTKLRKALREAGVEYKVYKNTMTGIACKEAGYGDMEKYLGGMTALALSEKDPVAPAKVLKEYAEKIESFEIKAGFVDGSVIDQKGVLELANIPNKETLVCKIMLGMRSPLQNLAYLLQAVIDKQNEGSAEAAPAAE